MSTYNKLVRDNIPDIIKAKGQPVRFHVANDAEFEAKLLEKLIEEAQEFMKNPSEEELADVLEVVDAIQELSRFSRDRVCEIKKAKADERGKFEKRIILDES